MLDLLERILDKDRLIDKLSERDPQLLELQIQGFVQEIAPQLEIVTE